MLPRTRENWQLPGEGKKGARGATWEVQNASGRGTVMLIGETQECVLREESASETRQP